MFIEIKVYQGQDADSPLYERTSAFDLIGAEEELGRIGRHFVTDVRRGKIKICDDCKNIITYGSKIVGEDDVEVEEGHDAECSKITVLV